MSEENSLTKAQELSHDLSHYLSDSAKTELQTMGSEDMQNLDLRAALPTIKIGHQTGSFEMPGGEVVKTFQGVVVLSRRFNICWLPKGHPDYTEENQVPWCVSDDCITGSHERIHNSEDPLYLQMGKDAPPVDYLFGKCAECWLNQFGSAMSDSNELGAGKQCKSQARLFIFLEDKDLSIPSLLIVPPTSLREWTNYSSYVFQQTNAIGVPSVVTEFSLEKKTRGGQVYSELRFALKADIAKDEPQRFAAIVNWRAAHKLELLGRDVAEDVQTKPGESTFEFGANVEH